VLPIAPSTCSEPLAKRADPARLSDRARRDEALRPEILRVFDANWRVHGVRKIWRQLGREGFDLARCPVERRMQGIGMQGIIRGTPHRTTIPDTKAPCPLDKVNRQFREPLPNMLWVSEFADVATRTGFACVAFASTPMPAASWAGALAGRPMLASFWMLWNRKFMTAARPRARGWSPTATGGCQYPSLRDTEPLVEARIEPSLGSAGDSHDTTLAETINGPFKAEVIHRRGPWRSLEPVEYATLEWADGFNNRRLPEPIGNIPPAEAKANLNATGNPEPTTAQPTPIRLRQTRSGSFP
jgi:transposase InsO family protein